MILAVTGKIGITQRINSCRYAKHGSGSSAEIFTNDPGEVKGSCEDWQANVGGGEGEKGRGGEG